MNTKRIRSGVFETNSSSSHSLTMGKGKLVKMPFSKQTMRQGMLKVTPGYYEWEWQRFYSAENKIAYLATHCIVSTPSLGYEAYPQTTQALLDESPQFKLLHDVVKAYTGCSLSLDGLDGSIDHQSRGCADKVFASEESLRQFLFDEEAYVEIGNDNNQPPLTIPTDRGSEDYLLQMYATIPANATFVEFRESSKDGVPVISMNGHVLESNDPLLGMLGSACVVVEVNLVHRSRRDSTMNPSELRHQVAQGVRDRGFSLVRDFQFQCSFERIRKTEPLHWESIVTYKMALPEDVLV